MLRRQRPPLDSLSFLAGDSEMARRIREFDWSDHPFGPLETWPQSLRSALSICLHSAFPTAIYWGMELRLLYNDAWAPIPGPRHPDALGAPAQQVWSDIWHIIEPQFTQLIETGEGIFVEDQMLPMRRFGALEETYWSYSFTPIRGEDGRIAGVFNSGSETTRNVLSQRQMRFLLELGEEFRKETDLRLTRRKAVEMLGRHLGVDRVGFRELTPSVAELAIAEEWTAPGVAPVGASVKLSDLGPEVVGRLRSGRVLRIDDIGSDPDIGDARKVFEAMGVAAAVAVPWTENGETVAAIFLHSREPRQWNDFDVTTAEEVLERTLTWMERERAAERERIMTREIDHRARNALAVVQSVVRLTLAEDVVTFREKIEDRIAALARCHALLSSEHWAPIELGRLLGEELAPFLDETSERVSINGPPVQLRAEQAQTVVLLLHELTTNAVKYGALSDPGGVLRVGWSLGADRSHLKLEWSERFPADGVPSAEVREDGFGSTLLDRVVEQQLGGAIVREFDDGGLKCVIDIPLLPEGRMVGREPPRNEPEPAQPRPTGQKSVLIVEDEAIVAMDLESMVESFGYAVFGTFASVGDALAALDNGTPDVAVVDMNLAGDSSLPVAEALFKRGVPLVFATGYAELGELPEGLATAPRLSKPVSEKDLKKTIAELAG